MGTSIHALPQIPASVLPLPSTPQTALALPTAGVTLLEAGFVPYFPPELVAEATGEGTATAVVSGSLTAEASASSEGASSADLLPIQYLAADAAGVGDSSAEVTTAESITVDASSEGTSSVDLAVVITAEASGVGSSSVDTAVRIDAIASGSGNAGAEVTLVGVLMPNTSGEGTSSVEVKTFSPSSMTKNGLQDLGSTTGEVQITGWLPDTSGYPGSTVNSNQLVVQTSGEGLTVRAYIQVENTSFLTRQLTLRLRLADNTEIATSGQVSFSGDEIKFITAEVTGLTLAQGALIRATAQQSNGNAFDVLANSASYVRVFKP